MAVSKVRDPTPVASVPDKTVSTVAISNMERSSASETEEDAHDWPYAVGVSTGGLLFSLFTDPIYSSKLTKNSESL